MKALKEINIYGILLSIINFICGTIHLIFEFILFSNTSIYREFLLIENILISFIFYYFSYNFILSGEKRGKSIIQLNISFWIIFLMLVLVFQPKVTSLNMINDILPASQKYILLFFSTVTIILSVIDYRSMKFPGDRNK